MKAVNRLIDEHRAQAIHYPMATGMRLGILVNSCATPQLAHERLVP